MELASILHTLESLTWLEALAAFLTIVGIPYAITYTLIRLAYKAKHKIYFIPSETYHEAQLVDRPNNPQSLWLQVMVKNKGFEISRDAEVYMSEIWKNESGHFQKIDEFRAPTKLKWSHEADIFPIDILPRSSRRLDVCFICEGEAILYLMTKGFPSGSIKNALGPGHYIFVLNAVSQNGLLPASFLFEVKWDGEWKNITGDSFVKSFRLARTPARSFRWY